MAVPDAPYVITRPFKTVLAAVVTADPAMKLPDNVLLAPNVINVPVTKYTLSAVAPFVRIIEALAGRVKDVPNRKMYSPAPFKVNAPADQVPAEEAEYVPGVRVEPPKSLELMSVPGPVACNA